MPSADKKGVAARLETDDDPNPALFGMRWLLFRLMYLSGIVKLTSGCPTWWGLTAMDWHYESQCLPTPLAWYAHQLPSWMQQFSVVAVYVIEIGFPFVYFAPLRSLRLLAFLGQVLLMALIMLTGNYNFFNILTIVLSLSLLEDRDVAGFLPACLVRSWADQTPSASQPKATTAPPGGQKSSKSGGRRDAASSNSSSSVRSLLEYTAFAAAVGLTAYACVVYFGAEVVHDANGLRIDSSVQFTKAEFAVFVTKSLLVGVAIGAVALVVAVAAAVVRAIRARAPLRLGQVLTVGCAVGVLFWLVADGRWGWVGSGGV